MVSKKQIDNEPEIQSEKTLAEATSQPVQPQKKAGGVVFSGLALVIALAALVLTIYSYYLNQSLNRQLAKSKTHLSDQLAKIDQQQTYLQKTIQQAQTHWQASNFKLSEELDGLNKRIQESINQRNYDNQDWLLRKAQYCLEIAQVNAHWSDNIETTLALLEQADTILASLQGQAVYQIRQALANEISQIKAKPKVDKAGLLSQLDALQQQINQLNFPTNSPENSDNWKAEPKGKSPSAWREKLMDSVSVLEKMVVIRHHNEDIRPLLSPLYQAAVKESIRMNLQQAQWAILEGNDAIYRLSLQEAGNKIKQSFNSQASSVGAVLVQIDQLKQTAINIEPTEIGQSLSLLNQLIKDKPSAPKANNSAAKGGNKP